MCSIYNVHANKMLYVKIVWIIPFYLLIARKKLKLSTYYHQQQNYGSCEVIYHVIINLIKTIHWIYFNKIKVVAFFFLLQNRKYFIIQFLSNLIQLLFKYSINNSAITIFNWFNSIITVSRKLATKRHTSIYLHACRFIHF